MNELSHTAKYLWIARYTNDEREICRNAPCSVNKSAKAHKTSSQDKYDEISSSVISDNDRKHVDIVHLSLCR